MDKPWQEFYPPALSGDLDYPSIPLHGFLRQSAGLYPDRSAIISYDGQLAQEGASLSYRELDHCSDRFAAALINTGIKLGDRVAYFMQNSPEMVIAFFGILKAGAIPVPCNPMYRKGELAWQLADSGARLIVCDSQAYPIVKDARQETSLEMVVTTGEVADALNYTDFIGASEPLNELPAIDPQSDLALLPYTGGTTGVPKGAMLSHENMVVNTTQFARWYNYRPGREIFISTLPLFHIGGITGAMCVPIAVGGTMILFPRFHPRGVLQAIQDYGATRFPGVPTMYIAVLGLEDASKYDLGTLSHCRTSAASLPAAVKRDFDALVGHEVLIEGYGLTETSPLTHANPTHRSKEGSMGVPLPNTEARIMDPDAGNNEMPPGEVGELALRGPQVMRGYWKKPEETAAAIRDGWFYTGDLAYVDADGYFFIIDRKKDVINAAGFKVWPREVEEVLYRHHWVKMAAVVGKADLYRGETVKAVVVLNGACPSLPRHEIREELIKYCRRELAAYKVPRILEFRDSLPVSAAGKVLRRVLREPSATSTGN